ncbi:uncharacterized protein C8Q71DRAFT_792669 [Rhodofomes roseus]|uniref:Tat pathway signal sequence n=1 Tax=Rhodofomes roseus TaxID=34475 RepID=A0A4Y9XXE0_9APHY|nr:uncharacterized protein C8Q71DRAFT_792669 [Rhodofomes roseus]KAH9828729.1 hypothetical protein C8Q71DRAFT_792669 [Rhodofomes roseus]TFY54057.1 hypothetical protein EVJ58_g9082 [Rhodofomes roseus]
MPGSEVRYARMPSVDSNYKDEDFDPTSPFPCDSHAAPVPSHSEPNAQQTTLRRYWPTLVGLTFFCASLVLFYRSLHVSETQCAERLSAYSPAIQAVEYNDVVFNGSLRHPSEFRGSPTPELDAAWDRISGLRPLRLSEDDLAKIGKESTPSLAKYHEEDGGGYFATIEIAHHMHCLNMLRKATYWDYYAPLDDSYQKDPDFHRVHLDHCIELLRQSLMCTADVGLITFNWVGNHRTPWPDFSTQHRCRNFDKIVDWNQAHSVLIYGPSLTRTEGVVDLPEPGP